MASGVEVGLRVPHELFGLGRAPLASFAAAVEDAGLDRVWVGDHVSFRGGQGYDGLLQAMALAALTDRVKVQTAVYLLALRHPVPVARQVASVAELAPGRLVLGVGVGGDDPAEVRNAGVDPHTRGARMDESLGLLRRLLAGEIVDHDGDHFRLEGAEIRPVPSPPVPIVVGGRSPAALRRAAALGDGWLGVFVDPERFAAGVASAGPGQHGVLAWCGFGRSPAPEMERLYQLPFERFERYAPYGRPADVAAALAPYVDAGASSVLLAAVADEPAAAVAGAAEVREALRAVSST